MTIDEIGEVMAQVTYKPGWSIMVKPGAYSQLALEMRMQAPDSTTAAHMPIEVISRAVLDIRMLYLFDRSRFLDWLFHEIMRMEHHEAQEWFRFQGELVDDPHASERAGRNRRVTHAS